MLFDLKYFPDGLATTRITCHELYDLDLGAGHRPPTGNSDLDLDVIRPVNNPFVLGLCTAICRPY